jgi:hypothetical protein
MQKYRKKPVEIDAFTFEEFVEYAKENSPAPHHTIEVGNKHSVIKANDEKYIIPTLEGVMEFTPQDMLIIGVQGEVYPCKLDIFELTYVKA